MSCIETPRSELEVFAQSDGRDTGDLSRCQYSRQRSVFRFSLIVRSFISTHLLPFVCFR